MMCIMNIFGQTDRRLFELMSVIKGYCSGSRMMFFVGQFIGHKYI